jgi:excinuclease Cho
LRDALRFLQVHTWPFAGAVDVVEKRGDWLQKHRINNWGYLGTWCSRREDFIDKHLNPSGFDADCYQILLKPVLLQTLEIQSISS